MVSFTLPNIHNYVRYVIYDARSLLILTGNDETVTASVSTDGLGAVFSLVDINLEVLDNSHFSFTRNNEFTLVFAT